jgi:hypothetical protein
VDVPWSEWQVHFAERSRYVRDRDGVRLGLDEGHVDFICNERVPALRARYGMAVA